MDNPREETTQKSHKFGNSFRNHDVKRNKRRGNGKKWNNTRSVAQGGNGSRGVNGEDEYQLYLNSKKNCFPAASVPVHPECGNICWQQSQIQQQKSFSMANGQRLFNAVSDPTVCGYSPMPLTYAMEPISLPPMYQFYHQVSRPSCRNYRGRVRRNHTPVCLIGSAGWKATSNGPSNSQINGYSSLQENNFNYSTGMGYQNGDYTSLPPAANIENRASTEEINSEHRRYSDPGLGPPQIPVTSRSEDLDSIDSGSSTTNVGKSSKLVWSLIEQVTGLKESNSRLFKELHQTKSELENVKLELNRLKQSSFIDYQPGMLSDIVREMRDAAKLREESLISKVKSMMNGKQSMPIAETSETAELDELKSQLARITDEKTVTETRLAKVKNELATLKSNANHEGQEIVALEEETLALRRELQEARASRTLAENHAAKMEKLTEILRKKINGTNVEETVDDIRGMVASGVKGSARSTSSSSMNIKMISNKTKITNVPSDSDSDSDSDSNSDLRSNKNIHSSKNNITNDNNGCDTNCQNLSGISSSELSGPVTDL